MKAGVKRLLWPLVGVLVAPAVAADDHLGRPVVLGEVLDRPDHADRERQVMRARHEIERVIGVPGLRLLAGMIVSHYPQETR